MSTPFSSLITKIDASYQWLIQNKEDGIYPVSCFTYIFYVKVTFSLFNQNIYEIVMIDNEKDKHGLWFINASGEDVYNFYNHGEQCMRTFDIQTIEELLEITEKCDYDHSKFPQTDLQSPPTRCPTNDTYYRRSIGYGMLYFPKNGKCVICDGELDDVAGEANCYQCKPMKQHNYCLKCAICNKPWYEHQPIYRLGWSGGGNRKTYRD